MHTYIERGNGEGWVWQNNIKENIFSSNLFEKKMPLQSGLQPQQGPRHYSLDAVGLSILFAVSDLHNICAKSHA